MKFEEKFLNPNDYLQEEVLLDHSENGSCDARSFKYQNCIQKFTKFGVKVSHPRLKKNDDEKLVTFFMVRNNAEISKSTKFYIILSISHVIADGYTAYRLFNAISDDQEIPILDRNPVDLSQQIDQLTNLGGPHGKSLMDEILLDPKLLS